MLRTTRSAVCASFPTLASSIAAVAMLAATARGGLLPVVDQSTLNPTAGIGGWAIMGGREIGEVITVGQSGLLDDVDFQAYRYSGAPGNVIMSIRSTVDGLPSDANSVQPLYKTTVSSSLLPLYGSFVDLPITTVDVSAGNLQFTAGQQIAITFTLDSPGGGSPPWTILGNGDTAPGAAAYYYGLGWQATTGAYPVRTWVVVPEPSSLALVLAGGLSLLGLAWRRSKSCGVGDGSRAWGLECYPPSRRISRMSTCSGRLPTETYRGLIALAHSFSWITPLVTSRSTRA
jgi:hypothetical protein